MKNLRSCSFPHSIDIRHLSLSLVFLLACSGWSIGEVPAKVKHGSAGEIRLNQDIKYLSSDELEGRGVSTKGINKAADFIKAEFSKAGLDVTRVNGDAFQKFTMSTGTKLGAKNELVLTSPDGKSYPLKYDVDFRSCSFGSAGSFEGDLVFLGYGVEAPKKNYNEFEGMEVRGKVVIIMRRVPRQSDPKGPFSGPHGSVSREASLSTKVSNAYRYGASAVLVVNDPYTLKKNHDRESKLELKRIEILEKQLKELPEDKKDQRSQLKSQLKKQQERLQGVQKRGPKDVLMKFGYGGNIKNKSAPVGQLTIQACNELLKESLGQTVQEIESEIDKNLKPKSAVLKGWKAKGTIDIAKIETEVKNVIGVLEGEGPLKEETIVIGAHYDHVGYGGFGSLLPGSTDIHNGADDNASGTVSLIELARRLTQGLKSQGKQAYGRRLVFIAFTAEERGLVGSAHYCKHPIFPLHDTIAMFNMDMVGRLKNEKLTIFGAKTAPRWEAMLKELGNKHRFHLMLKPEGFGPSDHTSFYAKKIPVLHLFTGIHSDYHRPSDDWNKINVEGMNRVVSLLHDVVSNTLKNPKRPEYVAMKARAKIQRSGSRPYFGSIPDFGVEADGYAISGVAPGSPADIGKLKGGDVIIQLGEHKIGGLDDFDLALRKFSAGDEVKVIVLRKEKKVSLQVLLTLPK